VGKLGKGDVLGSVGSIGGGVVKGVGSLGGGIWEGVSGKNRQQQRPRPQQVEPVEEEEEEEEQESEDEGRCIRSCLNLVVAFAEMCCCCRPRPAGWSSWWCWGWWGEGWLALKSVVLTRDVY
jgi:hypothetical protein